METQTLPTPAAQWLTITGEELPSEAAQLPADKVATLAGLFAPFMQQVVELRKDAMSIEVTDEDDRAGMAEARRLRLAIKNIRTEAEKIRKDEKQFSLITGRIVDWFGRSIRDLAEVTENHLKDQETYAERMEAERRARLKAERESALSPFIEEGMAFSGLDTMDEAEFSSLLENVKAAHAYRVQKQQEEEEARKAEEMERARIYLENQRLKQEAEERERAEREKQQSEAKRAAAIEAQMKADAQANAHEKARHDLWRFLQDRHGLALDENQLQDLIDAVTLYIRVSGKIKNDF